LARKLLYSEWRKLVLIRFKESVRVRVWGKEMSRFRKGEVHAVPTAVAGVLLAQGCAEPVDDSWPHEAVLAS
jgi:hypothetical protein